MVLVEGGLKSRTEKVLEIAVKPVREIYHMMISYLFTNLIGLSHFGETQLPNRVLTFIFPCLFETLLL